MTKQMTDMIMDKLRDLRFKGINIPSFASANLPSKLPSCHTITMTKESVTHFRDSYLLLMVALSAILDKADFNQFEIEDLLCDLALGKKYLATRPIDRGENEAQIMH